MEKIMVFFVMILIVFSSCKHEVKDDFVHVKGYRFFIGDKPYSFIGTNLWYGSYLGMKGNDGNRERLCRELDRLRALGITNLRIIGAGEKSTIKNSLRPAFQDAPGIYNEKLLDGFDFFISEMKKRGMHAVVFLNNYWEWSGGMLQYLAWANNTKPDDPSSGIDWNELMTRETEYYSNSTADKVYRQYIKMMVNRKNVYTGIANKDESTIMAWELANEPRGGEGHTNEQKKEIFCRWVENTALYIHSIDEHHLVTTGSEGAIGCKGDYRLFEKSHKPASVDYITFHLWPNNWDWFKADSSEKTFNPSLIKSLDYIKAHIASARKLGKPVVMEEFGFRRDSLKYTASVTVKMRDIFYDKVLSLVCDSMMAGAPIPGVNFWGWAGEGRPGHPDGTWEKGNDYVIEPPFEAQGINSVFDTDSGTISILKKYILKAQNK